MQNPTVRRAAAVGAVVLILALIALLFWPRAAALPEVAAPAPPVVREKAEPARAASAGAPTPKDLAELVEGPSEDEIPGMTEKCDLLVGWHQAKVPMWVIQDNAMAQGMKFTEEDLACLTAGGLPPGILDYAEANMLRFPVKKGEP